MIPIVPQCSVSVSGLMHFTSFALTYAFTSVRRSHGTIILRSTILILLCLYCYDIVVLRQYIYTYTVDDIPTPSFGADAVPFSRSSIRYSHARLVRFRGYMGGKTTPLHVILHLPPLNTRLDKQHGIKRLNAVRLLEEL